MVSIEAANMQPQTSHLVHRKSQEVTAHDQDGGQESHSPQDIANDDGQSSSAGIQVFSHDGSGG
jgi:hypothetical protein